MRVIFSLLCLGFISQTSFANWGIGVGPVVGVGGGYHASTAAEGYLRGFADYLRAVGVANLDYAMSQKYWQDAYEHYLKNRKLAVVTRYEILTLHEEWRKAHAAKPKTPEQIEKIKQAMKPKGLKAGDYNATTKTFNWPLALQSEPYQKDRLEIEKLYALRVEDPARNGLDSNVGYELKERTERLQKMHKAVIRTMETDKYIVAMSFLQRLWTQVRIKP